MKIHYGKKLLGAQNSCKLIHIIVIAVIVTEDVRRNQMLAGTARLALKLNEFSGTTE
jgi:hypothetical protein